MLIGNSNKLKVQCTFKFKWFYCLVTKTNVPQFSLYHWELASYPLLQISLILHQFPISFHLNPWFPRDKRIETDTTAVSYKYSSLQFTPRFTGLGPSHFLIGFHAVPYIQFLCLCFYVSCSRFLTTEIKILQ